MPSDRDWNISTEGVWVSDFRPSGRAYDVVVVGASTAGLYVAQLLATEGLKVALIERQVKSQPNRRTLIVTPAFGQVLDSGIPEAVTLHRSGMMRVVSGEASCDIRFLAPDPIVERAAMTARLASAAREAGAELLHGWSFDGFGPGTKVRFRRFRGGSAETDLASGVSETVEVSVGTALVGGDGVLTDVGPASRLRRPRSVPILQAEIELPVGWDADVTQVWFDVEETPYFCWLIPESRRQAVAGVIGTAQTGIRRSLDRFLEREGMVPLSYQGARVALYHPWQKISGSVHGLRVLLVGDAAGHVKVTTVGGTVTGLDGARAAARAILRGTSYRRELRGLNRELNVHWALRWLLDRLDNKGYAQLIRVLSGGGQDFLGRYHRDEMARFIWRLPLLEPRLLGVGLRGLLLPRKRTPDDTTAT